MTWELSDSAPQAYERHLVPAFFARFAERLIDLTAPRDGERVVDVACGTGVVARQVAARVGDGGSVVGVDSSPGMLDVARATDAPVDWLEADAMGMPLPDGSADLVLCQQGLQFFPDRPAALREMRRVLAPGGRLGLSVWGALDANPGCAVLVGALDRHAGEHVGAIMRRPFPGMEPEQLRALVAGAGFRDVQVHIRIEPIRFPSAHEFLLSQAAASPLTAPLAALSGEVRDELARDLADSLRLRTDDEGVVFPMETQVVTAAR